MIIILETLSAFLLVKGRPITGAYLDFDQIEEIIDVLALPNYILKKNFLCGIKDITAR